MHRVEVEDSSREKDGWHHNDFLLPLDTSSIACYGEVLQRKKQATNSKFSVVTCSCENLGSWVS